jgi:ATP-dependent exoDNAse (exonuclease V) beta subunit
LEFPVVILSGIGEEKNGRSDEIKIRENTEKTELLYLPDADLRNMDMSWRELAEKDAEEEKRINYVAFTRARDILVLSGIKEYPPKGLWKYIS